MQFTLGLCLAGLAIAAPAPQLDGVTGALGGATGALGGATGALGGATGALGGVTGGATGALGGVTGTLGGATGGATGALGGVTGAVGGLTGGGDTPPLDPNYKACTSTLSSNLNCCATDVEGIVDLDCAPPKRTPGSAKEFEQLCAAVGQQARCCALTLLGQGVLCSTIVGL